MLRSLKLSKPVCSDGCCPSLSDGKETIAQAAGIARTQKIYYSRKPIYHYNVLVRCDGMELVAVRDGRFKIPVTQYIELKNDKEAAAFIWQWRKAGRIR
jgi:hypothetical protein